MTSTYKTMLEQMDIHVYGEVIIFETASVLQVMPFGREGFNSSRPMQREFSPRHTAVLRFVEMLRADF